jgi:hypothetical protein
MSAGRRWALFAFEVALGLVYVAAFAVFVTQSRDFLVARDNERAAAAARATPPALPTLFEFNGTSESDSLLGVDWWPRRDGDGGVWSKTRPYVYLPVPVNAGDIDLVIDGEAFVAPGHETVDLTLTVDGARATVWIATDGRPQPPITVTVPASATGDGIIELRLDVASPAVPLHFGDPSEEHEIGYLLRSVALEPH